MVVIAHQGDAADGDRFLSYIEMKKAAHLAGVVILERDLLEAPDAAEVPEEGAFFIGRQRPVDRGIRVDVGLFFDGGGHALK
jgi:hypothetical protein